MGERCSSQLDGIPGLEWRQGHQKLELTVCLETALGLGDSAWQHRVAWRCQRAWSEQDLGKNEFSCSHVSTTGIIP